MLKVYFIRTKSAFHMYYLKVHVICNNKSRNCNISTNCNKSTNYTKCMVYMFMKRNIYIFWNWSYILYTVRSSAHTYQGVRGIQKKRLWILALLGKSVRPSTKNQIDNWVAGNFCQYWNLNSQIEWPNQICLTPNIWQTQLWCPRSKRNMWLKIMFLA